MIIFEKEYSGESIIDLPEDMGDMFDIDVSNITVPQDEYGIHLGRFIVKVEWLPE